MSVSKADLARMPLSGLNPNLYSMNNLDTLNSPSGPETLPLGDWVAEELAKPAQRYLLKHLIFPKGLLVIAGRPKLGKSFLAMTGLMAMSAGRTVGLLEPVGVSASLYLDLEGVARETAARAEGLRLKLGWGRGSLQNVHMYVPRKFEVLASGYAAKAVELVRATGAQTLVIDTFATSFTADENSKRDVQKYLNVLKEVREATECATVLVHHVNKATFAYKQTAVMMDPDAGLRGSSALQGGYDTIVSLQDGWINGKFQTAMIVRGKYCGGWWAEFDIKAGADVHAEGLPETEDSLVKEFSLCFGGRQSDYALFDTGPTTEQPGFRQRRG